MDIPDSSTPRTASEYRSWWEANTSVPYGYCWCGCNEKTETSQKTRAEHGYVKGCPRRFRRGHDKRLIVPADSERAICTAYEEGKDSRTLAVEWEVGKSTILRVLRRGNVTARPGWENHRQYTCDHYFFDEIGSESKAYWLGFIAADGYVARDGRLHIGLQRRDHEHLERFREAIQATYPVKLGSSSNGFPTCHITISSKPLARGLALHGVVNRKARILCWPPSVSEPLLRHYLRGYFDGDGSVGTYNSPYTRKRDGKRARALIWGITGTRELCQSAQDYLIEKVGVGRVKMNPHHTTPGCVDLKYGGNVQVPRIVRFLYEDATVYLPRKRDKVTHVL